MKLAEYLKQKTIENEELNSKFNRLKEIALKEYE